MMKCPRGTRDFLPADMERRRTYESVLRDAAHRFGFKEIQTPIFEDADLFILRSGPNIMKELYAFKDKGDRDLALRPEMTAPVIRAFVNGMSNEPRPVKVFYFGQCFRYERPQSGRYREFFQFGAEIIGSDTPESDAEAVALAVHMVKALGLKDYRVRIGHIGVLRQKLADAGVPGDRTAEVLQKLDKKLYDEAGPLLRGIGVSDEDVQGIFALTETVGGLDVLDKISGEARESLKSMTNALIAMGVKDLEVDLGVIRGLDYYTGMVFEIEAPILGAEKQICGGGAYSLSELFGGEKVPSTGFAVGFDRALLVLEKEGAICSVPGVDAYVVPVSDAVRTDALKIVSQLRMAGVSADVDLMDRKMSKAMKYAASSNARTVVIVGPREMKEGTVTVRDMSTGSQEKIPLLELAGRYAD